MESSTLGGRDDQHRPDRAPAQYEQGSNGEGVVPRLNGLEGFAIVHDGNMTEPSRNTITHIYVQFLHICNEPKPLAVICLPILDRTVASKGLEP